MTAAIEFGGVAANLLLASACYFVVIRRSGRSWLIYMGLGHFIAALGYATGPAFYSVGFTGDYVPGVLSKFHALVALCSQASARALFLVGALRLFGGPIPLGRTISAIVAISTTIAATYMLAGSQGGRLTAGLISDLCFFLSAARLFGGASIFHWLTGVSFSLRGVLTAVSIYGSCFQIEAQTLEALLVPTFACIAMTGFGVLLMEFDEIRQRLLDADNSKTMFLASMSHELRTPLNAIIGFSEILGTDGISKSAEDSRRYASYILDAGRSLLGLVDQVLYFTSLCTGAANLARESVSISRVLEESVKLLRDRATQNGVEIRYQRPAFDILLDADATAVRRIATSLIQRAVDVSPKGSVVEVRARLHERSQLGSIEVEDGERKSPVTSFRRIFKSFGRVENAYRSDKSDLGLEMAIVDRLLTAIGGRIVLSSNVTGGSLILAYIPAAKDSDDSGISLGKVG